MKDLRGELAHFWLLSCWVSDEALVRFAGADSAEIVNPTPEEHVFVWPSSQPPGITTSFTHLNHHMLNKR